MACQWRLPTTCTFVLDNAWHACFMLTDSLLVLAREADQIIQLRFILVDCNRWLETLAGNPTEILWRVPRSGALACAVLWLLLLTGEMMKWAHLSDFQVNGIAAAQLTLTSGVAAVVMTAVAYGLALKARVLYTKHHKVTWICHGCPRLCFYFSPIMDYG